MSNIYNLEPPTKGKVLLKTSLGDLEIELWAKEAPKACRNFVQLCMEGYYDNTIFHRVIKDYIAQGGDPTGSGTGGESIYGEAFKDEFHSRLKFTHRGLVACANQNELNTNGSQFFITLDKTDWLDKKNTIFGRVVGDTIYNLLRFNDVEVDGNDRPLEPPVVKEAEVVWNPFDDIFPRIDKAAVKAADEARKRAEEAKKRTAGRTKNLALLSFGEEAEEEEAQLVAAAAKQPASTKFRSAHDVLQDDRLAKERAVEEEFARPAKKVKAAEAALDRARTAVTAAAGRADAATAAEGDEKLVVHEGGELDAEGGDGGEDAARTKARGADFAAAMRVKMQHMRQQMGDTAAAKPPRPSVADEAGHPASSSAATGSAAGSRPAPRERSRSRERSRGRPDDDESQDGDGDGGEGGSGRGRGGRDYVAERHAELDGMRAEARNKTYGRVKTSEEVADADLLKPWQLSREKYKQRKRLVGDREKDTLARLAKFQSVLRAPDSAPAGGKAAGGAVEAPDAAAASDKGYDGKVRDDIDHKAYMPAAWRVDAYLQDDPDGVDADGGEGLDLASLRQHRFEAAKDRKGAMTRDMENLDDYVVYDPLLEKSKGKFSKAHQQEKKRNNEWAGRSNA